MQHASCSVKPESCDQQYFEASLKKDAIIMMITAEIGKAAIIETVCRLLILLSENKRAIGSMISRSAQNSFIPFPAS